VAALEDLAGRSVLVPPGPGQDAALARLREQVPDVTVVRPSDTVSARTRFAGGAGAALLADQVTNARAAADGEATILRGRTPAALDVTTPYLALAAHQYGYVLRAEDTLAARLEDALTALQGTDRYERLRERFFQPDGLPRPR
jgi:ABC-type amino acid transport substrate-binding protein